MKRVILFVVLLKYINGASFLNKYYDEIVSQNLLEEQTIYFEGDMLLTADQEKAISEAKDARNGLRDGAKRWPNRTVVYYIVENDFATMNGHFVIMIFDELDNWRPLDLVSLADEEQIKIIEAAMLDITNHSCVKFQPRKIKDEHSVTIQGSEKGCYSNVGVTSDDGDEGQVLNLAKGCFKHGTVVHEMLHTLGFYHMQSTYDRDDYVKIIWENITPGHEHNFAKYTNDTVTDFGVKYDYDSVMHYPAKAFSKNGEKTIIPLQENVTIGQREGLSERDVIKLNKMYCQTNEEDMEESNLTFIDALLSWKNKYL